MKRMKLLKLSFLLTLLLVTLAACKDDDYTAYAPLYSGMEVRSLTTGSDQIHVGERFVAEVTQSQTGSMIYRAKYNWTITDESEDYVSHYRNGNPKEVVYDNDPSNPLDTIRISKAGTYTISFSANFWGSGNSTALKGTPTVGTYNVGSYTYMTFTGLSKTIQVLPAQEEESTDEEGN